MKRYFLFITSFLILLNSIKSQELDKKKLSSFEGRHFYVGFMQNEIVVNSLELQIYISSTSNANIEVHIPRRAAPDYYSISNDSVLVINIPPEVEVRESEEPFKSLVEIISDVPITVYAFSSQLMSTDSYAAIPVSYWGKEYVVLSMPNDQYQVVRPDDDSLLLMTPRSSEFMVMAAYDSTEINFTPKAVTIKGKQTYQNYTVILNKGECYLVKSFLAEKTQADLTGTIVRSNKPIGFLSGHVRSSVPQYLPYPWNSKNHLVEMLFPTDVWGRMFVSVPFDVNLEGDYFKVTAIKPGTTIIIESEDETLNINLDNPGSWAQLGYKTKPMVWRSNNPIQIGQMMMHSGSASDNQDIFPYDPCLVVLPPVEQFVSRILFQVPKNAPNIPTQFYRHYIYLVIESKALSSLKLDGTLVQALDIDIWQKSLIGTNLYWTRFFLKPGKHELVADSGNFAGIIYGVGPADAYAMVLGASLNNPYRTDDDFPRFKVDTSCGKLTGIIYETDYENNTGIGFVQVIKDSTLNYKWNISPPISDTSTYVTFTAEPINIFKDGKIVIDYRDKNGNGGRYRYFYHSIKVDYPDTLFFIDNYIGEKNCLDFSIRNLDTVPLKIDSIVVANDTRLTLFKNPKLPSFIPVNSSVNCQLCFEPITDPSPLIDSLIIYFDCKRTSNIIVRGNVVAPLLVTSGLDFGDVKVGTTVCDSVFIINYGNVKIRLDSLLNILPCPNFIYDTTSFFPKTISSSDTLWVRVCFSPDSMGDFENIVKVENEFRLPNQIAVKGKGVAPIINSISIDWGKRRIGTSNDTSFYLINTGTFPGRVSFIGFTYQSNYPVDPARDVIAGIDTVINSGDSVRYDILFKPLDTLDYRNRANLTIDWHMHEPVIIDITGKGTIPTLTTRDYIFDTTIIYNRTDAVIGILKSGGNELLTIDSIYYLSGDIDDFKIDFSLLKNLKLQPDSTFSINVSYTPNSLGGHRIILGVNNDAMENYLRRIDTIVISGFAIPADTLDVITSIKAPNELLACINGIFEYTITNTGNVELELQKLELESENVTARWITPLNLPINFNPGEKLYYEINTVAKRDSIGKLRVKAQVSDTIKRITEADVISKALPLDIKITDYAAVVPGDTLLLEISGVIPTGNDIPIGIDFEIFLNIENFIVTKDICELLIISDSDTIFTNVTINQGLNSIIGKTERRDFKFNTAKELKLKLPLFVLLSSENDIKSTMSIYSDICFDPGEFITRLIIKEVCINNLRNIRIITNLETLKLLSNPVRDKIEIEINLADDEYVDISVFDYYGKNYILATNMFLNKGNHSLNFGTGQLSKGLYLLSIRNKESIKNLMFILSK